MLPLALALGSGDPCFLLRLRWALVKEGVDTAGGVRK